MQEIRNQNKKLKQLQKSCQEQLQKLKQVGKTHQNQIDTLLKFNERLLGIIENQFNTATKNKISSDLQIISEINQGNNQFNSNPKLTNKLASPPPIRGNNFQHQDLQGFEDQQEEEIYNKEMLSNQNSPVIQPTPNNHKIEATLPKQQSNKTGRLDRVYEMQHKDEQVSINLSNSLKTNNLSESIYNNSKREGGNNYNQLEVNSELQQLKDMIKQYRQQFVDNSSEYEQICQIIHNDLLNDLEQFKRIQQESKQFYNSKLSQVNSLRNQIKRFKPINELMRVIKKANAPSKTQKLLHQKIISKHM